MGRTFYSTQQPAGCSHSQRVYKNIRCVKFNYDLLRNDKDLGDFFSKIW